MRKTLCVLAVVLGLAVPAAAAERIVGAAVQTVQIHVPLIGASMIPLPQATTVANPTVMTFNASTDHATVVAGTAVLTKYEARYMDGTTVASTVDLGKPTPASGVITVPVTGQGLPKNKTLTAVVFAIGPGGSSGSAPSNPFAFLAAPAAATNLSVQ